MGNRIAQRRKELHFTQEELSEMIGISSQTISCIELGKKAARPENLARICSQLDISADYILFGKRSEKQMDDLLAKMAKLPKEEYRSIQLLVDLLYGKK
jgi:transcriptional regulator with XRE-family HTH domain